MPLSKDEMREYQRKRRAQTRPEELASQPEERGLVVPTPKVIKVGPYAPFEEPLGKFMLEHMTTKEVDQLLEKMDTHPSHGRGEKSRA